jgi:hypothetical protein
LIDLLFAISPERGLRAPAKLLIERSDPQTGKRSNQWLSIFESVQNGDRVLDDSAEKVTLNKSQLSTLAAQKAFSLTNQEALDPLQLQSTIDDSRIQGGVLLEQKFAVWISKLSYRLLYLLEQEGKKPKITDIRPLFSPERIAKKLGMENLEALKITIGLNIHRDQILEQAYGQIKDACSAAHYTILRGKRSADVRLLVNNVPGLLPVFLALLNKQKLFLLDLDVLDQGKHLLIKARVATRKNLIKNDLLGLFEKIKDLYRYTRSRPAGIKFERFNIVFKHNRYNHKVMSDLAETIYRSGGIIHEVQFTRKPSGFEYMCQIEAPIGSTETILDQIRQQLAEYGIKNLGPA